ncbi:MAG: prepilin-type N-terminal cleavage/methylation domain-containing protein [Proteobacteria bacterium]|nr:prepilin-type N-terminal cleavage/methylation domain-containing protein [Pseudomonadota bacterium]
MKGLRRNRQAGFTLIELLVTVAIIGILGAIAMPLTKAYMVKAEYSSLNATMRYLMDGMETFYIENDTFYPTGVWGSVRVDRGVQRDIPELKYTFPAGHKHRFDIYSLNLNWGTLKLNYSYIYVYADFDRNRNGRDDIYLVYMYLRDGLPYESGGVSYYRRIQQIW